MRIKAVLFDIDGTLYSNNQMYFKSIGFYLSRPRFMSAFRKMRRKLHHQSDEVAASGLSLRDFQAAALNKLTGSRASIPETRDKIAMELARWETIFDSIKPYPYVIDTLTALKKENVQLGVLTDFPLGDKLNRMGLSSYWDKIMTSEECGALKPNPKPFLALTHALGVDPRECLYVGNSYEFDVLGAKNVGMETAHLRFGGPVKGSPADFTFYDYRRLKEYALAATRR